MRKKYLIKNVLLLLLIGFPLVLSAQIKRGKDYKTTPTHAIAENNDTSYLSREQKDSILINNLQYKLQEYELNEIVLRSQLGKSAREDSIDKVMKRAQIDSLRKKTPGVPIVIEGNTLFKLYARRGGVAPTTRARSAEAVIMSLGKRLSLTQDTLYIFESDYASDIMCGDEVIVSLTDHDGLWQNTTRSELAQKYLPIISKEISLLQKEYGLKRKIQNILLGLLVIGIQVTLISLTYRLFKRLRLKISKMVRTKLKPLKIKDYEFLDAKKQGSILLFVSRILRLIIIIIQLVISIPILFSIFPETKDFAYTIFSYIWNPTRDILWSVLNYFPKIFKIIIVYFCFKYVVKGLRYMTNEVATGKLKINGFYADWAFPTYYILRFFAYSLMLIMIWPLLPNSESNIFQGVSVFIGLVISLGSTTVIGNLMAGLVITYMRPFKVGDFIKLQDTMGSVVEKTPFVTRLRTPKNDVVTIPNSFILSSLTLNYSFAAEQYGIIVHTTVTIGYDVEWKTVENLLISAALETKNIMSEPMPFVLATQLDDFYCSYEINAYTKADHSLPDVYSNLHKNVIDKFNEAGIEIMSPHFYGGRDSNRPQMPESFIKK